MYKIAAIGPMVTRKIYFQDSKSGSKLRQPLKISRACENAVLRRP